MKPWRAIVFDLDDTLYPEHDYVLSGFLAVAEWAGGNFGIPSQEVYQDLVALYSSGIRGDTFNRWLAQSGHAPSFIPTLIDVYRRHEPRIKPFAAVPMLLEALRPHYTLGIVSDGYLDVQRRKWNALGLSQHFSAVVFSDQWGRSSWKPSTRPFEEIVARLGVSGCEAVYIADNPTKDFLGARGVGMYTVWFRRPTGEYAALDPPTKEHEPDTSVNCLTQLPRLLLGQATKPQGENAE